MSLMTRVKHLETAVSPPNSGLTEILRRVEVVLQARRLGIEPPPDNRPLSAGLVQFFTSQQWLGAEERWRARNAHKRATGERA